MRGGMALRARGHRLRAGPDGADGSPVVEAPGRDRDQRMDAEVELAAEAAAAGGRDDPHLVRADAEDQRDLVAVHVRRLGADRELDPVADAARDAGLGLDVRVLDERRLDLDLRGHRRASRAQRRRRRGASAAADEDVAGRGVVQRAGRPDRAPRRRPRTGGSGSQVIGSSASLDRRRASARRRRARESPRRDGGRCRPRAPAGPCRSGRCRTGSGPGTSARGDDVDEARVAGAGAARDRRSRISLARAAIARPARRARPPGRWSAP